MSTSHEGLIDLPSELREGTSIHTNLGQEIVVTSVDKLRLCLQEHRGCIANRWQWTTPASIVAAILLTMVTTDFRETWGYKPEFWSALYVMILVISAIGLVVSGVRSIRAVRSGSVDQLIERIITPSALGGTSGTSSDPPREAIAKQSQPSAEAESLAATARRGLGRLRGHFMGSPVEAVVPCIRISGEGLNALVVKWRAEGEWVTVPRLRHILDSVKPILHQEGVTRALVLVDKPLKEAATAELQRVSSQGGEPSVWVKSVTLTSEEGISQALIEFVQSELA